MNKLIAAAVLLNGEYQDLFNKYSNQQNPMDKPDIYSAIKSSNAFGDFIIENQELISSKTQNDIPSLEKPLSEKGIEAEEIDFSFLKDSFEQSKVQINETVKNEFNHQQNSQKLNSLTEIAVDLTEKNNNIDYNISQLGDYQIWRDKDDIAMVNATKKLLVVYGEINKDFFPTEVAEKNLKQFNIPDKLLSKIKKANPEMEIKYNSPEIISAYQKFNLLSYVNKGLNATEKQTEKTGLQNGLSSIKNILNIVKEKAEKVSSRLIHQFQEQIGDNLGNYQQKAEAIAARKLSDRLIKHAHNKFWQGRKRTGETKYQIDNYRVERDEKARYKIIDQNDKLLVSFEYKPTEKSNVSKLTVTNHAANPHAIHKALKAISDSEVRALGSPKQESIYQGKIADLVNKVSSYKDGRSSLGKSNLSLFKDNDNLIIKNNQGKTLVSANSHEYFSSIASRDINLINQAIEFDKQQQKVAQIAPVLKKYLELNETNKVDRESILVSFDPQSKIIFYLDKKQPENTLQAQLTNGGWANIQTNISSEKAKYFSDVVTPKIDDIIQAKNRQMEQVNPKRGRSR
jgi:hypothetical protein